MKLDIPAGEHLAEHTGDVDWLGPNPVRIRLLDRAIERVDELIPGRFTGEQRDRIISFAEEATVAGRDVDDAILAAIARGAPMSCPRVGEPMGPS